MCRQCSGGEVTSGGVWRDLVLHKYFGAGSKMRRAKEHALAGLFCMRTFVMFQPFSPAIRGWGGGGGPRHRGWGGGSDTLPPRGRPVQRLWAGAGRSPWSILWAAASEHDGKILPPSDMAPTCPAAAAGSGAAVRGSGQKSSSSFSRGAEDGGGGGGGGGGAARGPGC